MKQQFQAQESRKHLTSGEAEPETWQRTSKKDGHLSLCTRSTALHRLYTARPETDIPSALAIIDGAAGYFETSYARYRRVRGEK